MQIFKQRNKSEIKPLPKVEVLLIIFVTAIFIFLLYWFPRPYYFVWSDNEPDHLGNALHILDWGAVRHGHHPEIINVYI